MSDLDLDELRSELDDFAQPEKKGGRSAARGAHHRRIRGDTAVCRETRPRPAARGRPATSSSGSMPCASTACARLRNVVRFLRRSTIRGCWPERKLSAAAPVESMDEDELLAELGGAAGASDITELRHVRTSADKRAAEEIANRQKCEDFDRFKPLFVQVQKEIESGIRQTRPFELKAEIRPGSWFIVGGQKAYVAEMGEIFSNAQGRTDARLRVIFDNGTESNLLMRSLQRALHKDEAGRRITDPVAGPLFAGENVEGDQASGTIYVLRSKSDHPVVAANRDVLHKIGVTCGDVARRIANAKLEPTFLMADVEIVATYELYNINRTKLENLIHRIFDAARLDIEIKDRFGLPVIPREWFLVPLSVVDEAIEKIKDGTITSYTYDPKAALLRRRDAGNEQAARR